MIEAYNALVVAACLIAAVNWRRGLYAGILLDVLRDPVRKLSDEQSVAITLAGGAVWVVILLRVLLERRPPEESIFRKYRHLRTARFCVLLALLPAAALSIILYQGGYLLAAIGLASYITPLLAIGIGFRLVRSEEEVYRWLRFYSLVNALTLISVPLEYLDIDLPALGGINMVWVRYRSGESPVDLISGFYRSPDIMGLHASHVAMFAAMLATRRPGPSRWGWIGIALFAAACLLLSGRRKMIGMPLVFVGVCFLLGMARGVQHVRRLAGVLAVASLLAAAGFFFISDHVPAEGYTDYAATIATETHARLNTVVIGSAITTLQQSGVLGGGLGTATQGRYYAGIQTARHLRGWQEDGLSKMLLEFGLPGLLLMLFAGLQLLGALWASLRLVPPWESVQALQIGAIGVVMADAASFVISHQQFSGDPVSAMLVMILTGVALGAPRVYYERPTRPPRPTVPAGGSGPLAVVTGPGAVF